MPRVPALASMLLRGAVLCLALAAGGAALAGDQDVAKLQAELARRGYDPGPADGVWGAKTRAALQALQTDRGLEPTGRIDAELAKGLFGVGYKHRLNDDYGIPRERVHRLQERLAEAGHDPGSRSGLWDPATGRALAAYQAANGLDASGWPDIHTRHALGFVEIRELDAPAGEILQDIVLAVSKAVGGAFGMPVVATAENPVRVTFVPAPGGATEYIFVERPDKTLFAFANLAMTADIQGKMFDMSASELDNELRKALGEAGIATKVEQPAFRITSGGIRLHGEVSQGTRRFACYAGGMVLTNSADGKTSGASLSGAWEEGTRCVVNGHYFTWSGESWAEEPAP